ncbi:MAG: ABC transporter permease [Calditrichaeota bacterium]|nr:ABC transporter permease [Calditrichota bacterium]
MQRLLYLIQKEFRQIRRERMFVGIIFIMPIFQLILLGFAITTDIKNVSMVLVDEDHSAFSRKVEESFAVTTAFRYLGAVQNVEQAKQRIKKGEAQLAVVIPYHFERDVKSGKSPGMLILIDGVDGNSAGVIAAYVGRVAERLQKTWLPKSGLSPIQIKNLHLTELRTRMIYNPNLKSVDNIVPGILAILIIIITSFLTGMSIVREKEIGTLEQLMVTPLRNWELLAGKIIPMIAVVFLLLNVGILAAGLIFGLWIKGNLFSLYALALLFSLSGLSLGVFVSTISQTQQQAMFFAWFFMIFSILLSGFFIPIENMPPLIQLITYLNPVRYFMIVIREIYLKGTPIIYLWQQALAMTVFGIVMFVLAGLRFQKRLG